MRRLARWRQHRFEHEAYFYCEHFILSNRQATIPLNLGSDIVAVAVAVATSGEVAAGQVRGHAGGTRPERSARLVAKAQMKI